MNFEPIQGITWSEIRDAIKGTHARDSLDYVHHLSWRPVCQAHLLDFISRLVHEPEALLHKEIADLNDEIADLNGQIDDLGDEIEQSREHAEEIEWERDDLVEVHEERFASLREEIAKLKTEVEDYRRQSDVERDAIVRENVPTSWERVLGENSP